MTNIARPDVLINETYLKEYSPLPKNYDISEIIPYIKPTEHIWIEPVLGTALYEELLEQVKNNSLTAENSTLLLAVYPYLSFAVVYEALPFIGYHLTEVGITKGKSDNSDSVSMNDMNYITNHLRETVEYMKYQLKHWLDDHSESFPLYNSDDCTCSDVKVGADNLWIKDYYNSGVGRYDWRQFKNRWNIMRHSPNARVQVYACDRQNIDMY